MKKKKTTFIFVVTDKKLLSFTQEIINDKDINKSPEIIEEIDRYAIQFIEKYNRENIIGLKSLIVFVKEDDETVPNQVILEITT